MIPKTTTRVEENTAPWINARIRREAEARAVACAEASAEEKARRLDELDREWDVERALEANAAAAALIGLALGALVNRRFFVFPALVAGFLLQHALQGWCPPLPVLRRLGVRTAREIEEERRAIEALRARAD